MLEPLLQRALALRSVELPEGDARVAEVVAMLGRARWNRGDFAGAEALFRRALATEEALDPASRNTARLQGDLASALREIGACRQALPVILRSLELRRALVPVDDPWFRSGLDNLARTNACLERAESPALREADALIAATAPAGGRLTRRSQAAPLAEAHRLREEALGPSHPLVAEALLLRGRLAYNRRDYTEADRHFARAVAMAEVFDPDGRFEAVALGDLAAARRMRKRCEEAEPLIRRSIALRERLLAWDDLDIANGYDNLWRTLSCLRRHDEAREARDIAAAIRRASPEVAARRAVFDEGLRRWAMRGAWLGPLLLLGASALVIAGERRAVPPWATAFALPLFLGGYAGLVVVALWIALDAMVALMLWAGSGDSLSRNLGKLLANVALLAALGVAWLLNTALRRACDTLLGPAPSQPHAKSGSGGSM